MSRTIAIFALLLAFLGCSEESTEAEIPSKPDLRNDAIFNDYSDEMVPRDLTLKVIDPPKGGFDLHYRYIAGNYTDGNITFVGEPKKVRYKRGKTITIKEKMRYGFVGEDLARVLIYAQGYEPTVATIGYRNTKASYELRPMSTFRITPRISSDRKSKTPINVVGKLLRYTDDTIAEMKRFVTEKNALKTGKGAPYHLAYNDEVPTKKEHLDVRTTTQGKAVEFTNLPYSAAFPLYAYANGLSAATKKVKAQKHLQQITLTLKEAFGCEVLAFQETRDGKRTPARNASLVYTMRENSGEPKEVNPSETHRHFIYAYTKGRVMHDLVVAGQSKDPETGKVFISNPPLKVAEAAHKSTQEITLHEAYVYQVSGFGVKDGKEDKVDFADLHFTLIASDNEWLLRPGKNKVSEPFYSVTPIKSFKIRLEPTSDKRLTKRFKPEDIKRWESQTFTFDKDGKGVIRIDLS